MTRRWYAPSGPLHTLYLIVMVYIFYCWILSLLFSHASIILSWFSFRVFSIYSIFCIYLSLQLILVHHVISCHEEQLWIQGESWSMSSVASLHSSSFHYVLRTCVLPHCPQVRSCRYMYGYTLYIGTMMRAYVRWFQLHVRWLSLCLDSSFYISLNYTIYNYVRLLPLASTSLVDFFIQCFIIRLVISSTHILKKNGIVF